MADMDVGQFRRHRDEIVGQAPVQYLAFLVVAAFLEQRPADALRDAAPDLLLHQQRVDDPPAVLDHPVAEQPHRAGFRIDLQ